ncbi:hypothetical protein [Thalassospira lohafexi]|uniref:DUF1311 domain-containing protein n=1 Tax=Thalassospira lohafexi TaxID=744227 RepID=A0A2N3L6P9_9PROT|nr:hypothetical protein [Thalassospira lohafexi]PKR58416.1 hypothetical protein COO92_11810 [Thalassospira lohafexi]
MKSIWFYLFCALSLSGCGLADREYASWPVEPYSRGCEDVDLFLAEPPLCVSTLHTEDGFQYRDEFAACKQSMNNYFSYLDRMIECSVTKTSVGIEDAQREFSTLTKCKNEMSPECSTEKVEETYQKVPHSIIGLWFPLECQRDGEFAANICISHLNSDLDDIRDIYSAEHRKLVREAKTKSDEAIRLFNCKANREKFCF